MTAGRMPVSAITSPCNGGAIWPHRRILPSHHISISPNFLKTDDFNCNYESTRTRMKVQTLWRKISIADCRATSGWGTTPYEVSEGGEEYYLDEQDVVTLLDPPKNLIPLDPSSYNPASYLWKKIDDIPEERRQHLLPLLNPRLISRAWGIAGRRYDDPKLVKRSASILLPGGEHAGSLELWKIRTSGAPISIAWIHSSQKAIFCCTDGKVYGRFIGGYPLMGFFSSSHPLYFNVKASNEVMATEEPCDFAYEFGDGLVNLPEYPQEFPKPAEHPWPLNDQVVIYIRQLGPGVMVGQAWQEGRELDQVPKKLCGEMLMVKDY